MLFITNQFMNAITALVFIGNRLLFVKNSTSKGSDFLPDFNHIFDTAKGILTVVSLIAFIAALIALCFVYYNYNDRRKLKDNPREYVEIAEKLHIDFKSIPESERAGITRDTLNTRIKGQAITAGTLILLAIVVGIIMVAINKDNVSSQTEERKEKKQDQDSLNKAKGAKEQAVASKNKQLHSIDQFIEQASLLSDKIKGKNEKALKVDYYYFIADLAKKLNNPIYQKSDSTDVMDMIRYNMDHPNPNNVKTDSLYEQFHLQFLNEKLKKLRVAME